MAWYTNPTFWVAGSFTVFVGGVLWAGVHKKVAAMLDERSDGIAKQIKEARFLRDETEKLLIDLQRKQRDAEKEAAEMVEHAEEDAKILARQAEADMEVMVTRRTRVAKEKIAQAEAMAVKEVQAAAVSVAVEAATTVMADALKGKDGGAFIDAAIKDMDGKLH